MKKLAIALSILTTMVLAGCQKCDTKVIAEVGGCWSNYCSVKYTDWTYGSQFASVSIKGRTVPLENQPNFYIPQ